MTTKAPTSRRLAHFLAGPALALGVAIGSAGVANAVWDIGAYDSCIKNIPDDVYLGEHGQDAVRECCWKSGGNWDPKKTDNNCVAPGVDSQGRVPTHVMQPLPLPAPPGDIGTAPGQVG